MPTDRLQDRKYLPRTLTAAGMPSIYGGLAGVGQFEDPSLFDFGSIPDLGPVTFDPGTFDLGVDTTLSISSDVSGWEGVVPDVGTVVTDQAIDPVTNELTITDAAGETWSYSPPGGAAATDPGWKDVQGKPYFQYADGTRVYTDGTQINPNGSYYASDGTFYNPVAKTVTSPAGETITTAKILSGVQAVGQVASTLWQFAKGIIGAPSGPLAPSGYRAGQIFRDAATGNYYQVQADGTTRMVAPPSTAGLFGGNTWLLLGAGALALLLISRKRRTA